MNAYDVVPYLKRGTIVTYEEDGRAVLMVTGTDYGDHELVNIHNGKIAGHYSDWFNLDTEIELYENMEDWIQANFDKRKEPEPGTDKCVGTEGA